MAKFCSFDVGTGVDILLESEAKIKTKTLDDCGEGIDFNKKV